MDKQRYVEFSEQILWEGCKINGVVVHAVTTYPDRDTWYSDLIERAIPAMGSKYMKLFINCGFAPFLFLLVAHNESSIKYMPLKIREPRFIDSNE